VHVTNDCDAVQAGKVQHLHGDDGEDEANEGSREPAIETLSHHNERQDTEGYTK
jgi:hypothetical protein